MSQVDQSCSAYIDVVSHDEDYPCMCIRLIMLLLDGKFQAQVRFEEHRVQRQAPTLGYRQYLMESPLGDMEQR